MPVKGQDSRVESVCEWCGDTFLQYPSKADRPYCSKPCFYEGRKAKNAGKLKSRRMLRKHEHPLADKWGRVLESRWIVYELIGPGPHECHWCGVEVNWVVGKRGAAEGALVVDHVDGDSSNNAASNLVPSCQPCNVWRDHPHKIEDGDLWVQNGEHRTRAVERTCRQCGDTFLHMAADTRPNAGQFCSASCRAKFHLQNPIRTSARDILPTDPRLDPKGIGGL